MAVTFAGETEFTVLGSEALFELPEGTLTNNYSFPFEVSADGERFLMTRAARPRAPVTNQSTVIMVQNWLEELRRRVPVPSR